MPSETITFNAQSYGKSLHSVIETADNLNHKPISTWRGKAQLMCRRCADYVQVKEHVTGRLYGADSEGAFTIKVDYVTGVCAHVVEENSC